jgi:hypothetical protein
LLLALGFLYVVSNGLGELPANMAQPFPDINTVRARGSGGWWLGAPWKGRMVGWEAGIGGGKNPHGDASIPSVRPSVHLHHPMALMHDVT